MPNTPASASPKMRGILGFIEALGNKLPDPIFLFIGATVIVAALSALGSAMKWSVQPQRPQVVMESVAGADGASEQRPKLGPGGKPEVALIPSGSPITPRSLLTADGLYWLVANMIRNFLNFPPLGVVLVGMFGIGVAEKVGFFGAAMKWLAGLVPGKLLTPTVVFLGVMSNVASDAGYIVLPPLAAALYAVFKRPPLAGIAAAFAGVSAGFSANLLVGSTDALVAGLTETGARVLDPTYRVLPTCNWWFLAGSTFLLTLVGWGVTAWVVEPRLRAEGHSSGEATVEERTLTAAEKRGLTWAAAGIVAALGVTAAILFVPGAPLHGPMPAPAPTYGGIPVAAAPAPGQFTASGASENDRAPLPGSTLIPKGYKIEAEGKTTAGDKARGEFALAEDITVTGKLTRAAQPQPRWSQAVVPIILFVFLVPGVLFGIATGAIKSTTDVSKAFIHAMVTMAPVVAMAFFAAQFIECFKFSRLDTMLANLGGKALVSAGLPTPMLLIGVIVITMIINLLMSSMSAKWTALSPILVPMMMMAGLSPELTQAAYRVGDSVTNIVTPLNSYIIVILVAVQRWKKDAGIGSVIAMMLPYSFGFVICWAALLLVWVWLGWEIGPGAPLWYTPAAH